MSRADRSLGGVASNINEIRRRIGAHNVMVSSAGIAFYSLLALVPTLIALVSIYGIVTDPAEIEQQVADVAGSLDETTQAFIKDLLTDIVGNAETGTGDGSRNSVGHWLSLAGGIALALFSASGAVQKLIGTIAIAYEATENRSGWKVRLMAYGFTAAAIVGVAAMALVIGAAPALLRRANLGDGAESAIAILQFPALGLLFGLALTVLYRNSPDRSTPTPWRNPGAIVGTLLFIFFAIAFSIYSANVGVLPASYGLLGSIAALMIFLQLTALAVIIGAEVNSAVEGRAMASATAVSTAASPDRAPRVLAVANRAAGSHDEDSSKSLPFGKALAGLLALYALARGIQD